MKVLNEFKDFLERNKLDLNNQTVICAVSCGVDSMTLLDCLEKHAFDLNFRIVIAHVNHKKRAQSEIEEEFIRAYSKGKHDIEVLSLENYDLESNFQKKARDIRIEFFKDVALKYKAKYLFLAHHLNDDMETTFLRIMRKGSLESISGINELSSYGDLIALRPFMRVLKKDIYEYARENSIKYFEDSSNSLDDYARNRIRHNIIPEFFKENDSFDEAYLNFKESLNYASSLIISKRNEFISSYVTVYVDSFEFLSDYFLKLDLYMQKEVLFELLKDQSFGHNNIEEIIKIINSKKANLIINYKNICIIKEYNKIIISNDLYEKSDVFIEINDFGIYDINDSLSVEFSLLDEEIKKEKNIIGNIDLIWYNGNKFPFVIRNRRDGDRIKLSNGSKKVKDLLIDMHASLKDRDNCLVLLDNQNEIISVLNYRKSSILKDNCENNIQIKLIRREKR